MPCTDGGPSYSDELREENHRLKIRLDNITRMMCDLTKIIPKKYLLQVQGLASWVDEHAENDRKRIASEAAAKALAVNLKKKQLELARAEVARLVKETEGK